MQLIKVLSESEGPGEGPRVYGVQIIKGVVRNKAFGVCVNCFGFAQGRPSMQCCSNMCLLPYGKSLPLRAEEVGRASSNRQWALPNACKVLSSKTFPFTTMLQELICSKSCFRAFKTCKFDGDRQETSSVSTSRQHDKRPGVHPKP